MLIEQSLHNQSQTSLSPVVLFNKSTPFTGPTKDPVQIKKAFNEAAVKIEQGSTTLRLILEKQETSIASVEQSKDDLTKI